MARSRKQKEEDTESSSKSSGDSGSNCKESSEEESSAPSSDTEAGRGRDDLGPPCSDTTLSKFYERNKRVDAREVTCVLNNFSFKLYFRTMVGDGRLDREGRKDMGKKYFLGRKQFQKLTPPSLQETRLHCIDNKEYGILSEKLLHCHRYLGKIKNR